jgi:hypothetical protein
VLFAVGVMDVGANAAVVPAGNPVALRSTAELKPFMLVMVIVLVPLAF